MTVQKFNRSAHARNIGSAICRFSYRIRVVGAHHVLRESGPDMGGVVVVCSGLGSAGMLLVKSILARPSQVLLGESISVLGGDFQLKPPYCIDAQLASLTVVQSGGVIVLDDQMVDPGFLVMQSQAPVVPVSVWVGSQSEGVSEWLGKAPALRSAISVYFGEGGDSSAGRLTGPAHGGLLGASRFMSEWCRQLLQDHRQMVLHRLGGGASR